MDPSLRQLAELYHVEPAYEDATGTRREANPEAVLRVLQVLGAAVAGAADVPGALRQRRQELWRRCLEPVAVVWDGQGGQVTLRRQVGRAPGAVACRVEPESGEPREWSADWDDLPVSGSARVEGVAYEARRLALPGPLPSGAHRLTVDAGGTPCTGLLLSAPTRAYVPAEDGRDKTWGVFLPLYALHSRRSWGAGDFGDMGLLLDWVKERGGAVFASLPLLAADLDEPFEPSPYSPASRLFWNEFFLDVEAAPESARCPAAQALVREPAFRQEVEALRREPLVDYRRQMALKRRVLAELARSFFAEPGGREGAFRRFLAGRPRAEDYARFRGVQERQRLPWQDWPGRLREGDVREGAYDEEARRYHLYVQWLADEQLRALAGRARSFGPGLYLDLPLGVNGASYDVWRERSAFAVGMAGGAPPDPFFTGGQNWGFPPPHPEHIREQGYRYLTECLRHYLRYAGVLRIDHMMGLHRLYWVPDGMEAKDGVYVRYRHEELYALFSLESNRHGTVLVGEDLGTVPPDVRPAMARHRVQRMYVQQYELDSEGKGQLRPIPPGSVASVNTHDMPTFKAFWEGLDLRDREDLGLLDARGVKEEADKRARVRDNVLTFLRREGLLPCGADTADVLRGLLAYLATGPDRLVLINVEDLWGETDPQNTPGTPTERPNWRRKARYAQEAWAGLPQVVQAIEEIDRLVREHRAPAGAAG
jgi:4-alpha-glucanotransferase